MTQLLDPADKRWVLTVLKIRLDAHDDPNFKTEVARIIEGPRKAGLTD